MPSFLLEGKTYGLNFLACKTAMEEIFHFTVVLLSQPENCAALRLNFWKLFEEQEKFLLLNNTFKDKALKEIFSTP